VPTSEPAYSSVVGPVEAQRILNGLPVAVLGIVVGTGLSMFFGFWSNVGLYAGFVAGAVDILGLWFLLHRPSTHRLLIRLARTFFPPGSM
jgi:hypothetical protein